MYLITNLQHRTRLSIFYFFFFATLGAFIPYWPPYLKSLNFTAIEIGELMAIVMASKVISPFLLGWVSDHYRRRLIIIQGCLLVAIIAFSGVFIYQSYWWFVLVMVFFGFFWNASLPLFEALTLDHLSGNMSIYSFIRLWGSIGFIISVVVLPIMIFDDSYMPLLPLVIMGLLVINGLSSLVVKDKVTGSPSKEQVSLVAVLKRPAVLALLLSCGLQSLSHGAYYTFFSIYLETHDYSHRLIGFLWGLGVLAEVLLMIMVAVTNRLFIRYGAYHLFVFSLALTAVRWLVLAFWVDDLFILLMSQLLHAASFGLFHLSAISLFHDLFPGRLQGRGQALYAGISFGLGGTLGTLLSGYAWGSIGSTWTFFLSAVVAMFGAIIALYFVKKKDSVENVS